MIRISTQNDVNFKFELFHRKVANTENADQAVHVYVHCSLVRNYTAYPKMLFDKDSMIKRHMDIHVYADLSQYVSTNCPWG